MLDELEPRMRELERNRKTFVTFLESLEEARWSIPVGTEGYSAWQTLAHMAGAAKSMTRMAQNWIAQKENRLRPDFDLDFFNARQQEKRARMSKKELLEEWQTAHQGLIDFMETVRAEDLDQRGEQPTAQDTTLRDLFLIITTHEADHIRLVVAALTA